MADEYIQIVKRTEYKCFISPNNTYSTDKIYPIPNENKNNPAAYKIIKGIYIVGLILNTINIKAYAINEYPRLVSAVRFLDNGKTYIGNFTLINNVLLSTSAVIAAFVASVNIDQKINPVK